MRLEWSPTFKTVSVGCLQLSQSALLFILPENNSLLGPPSSIAGSPEKTTLSVDFGCILFSMADLKSNQINFRLTVRRFVSVDSSWADKVAI